MRAPALTADESIVRVALVSDAGILTWGTEELTIVNAAPERGSAVAILSGGRLAFRRVLEVAKNKLRLRCDVAPFEDVWDGDIVGCVRPRVIDRIAALDPERFTVANWHAAVAYAHALSVKRKFSRRPEVAYTTRMLTDAEWPAVRKFWKRACGDELHVEAQPHQHVIGLFDSDELVGANIHLVFGSTSYSAYTLVDRRYRGTGGGGKMIQHAVRFAREQKLESVYVHIKSRNLPSIRAYERQGFEQKGWWSDEADPLASAERQWRVLEITL
jgi:RimJ/RimL family protein N-acetyltransferase